MSSIDSPTVTERKKPGLKTTALKGIGPAMADKLAGLGIYSALDLLFHLPSRYQDRTQIQPIAALRRGDAAMIEGEITQCKIAFGRRRSLLCTLRDNSGCITLRFFHFSSAQKQQLAEGARLRCYGECNVGRQGLELVHPEYSALPSSTNTESETADGEMPSHLTAIYPSSEGIHQQRWRNYIAAAFAAVDRDQLRGLLPDHCLPTEMAAGNGELYALLHDLHYPDPSAAALLEQGQHPAQRKLALEELTARRLSFLLQRRQRQSAEANAVIAQPALEKRLLDRLPFSLTAAQRRVLEEIKTDLAQKAPMMRLLQGDVGAGKTVVAALAALHCIGAKQQVALMVPTEILAEQHADTLSSWLSPIGVTVSLLTGKISAAAKRQQLQAIQDNRISFIVGTHALIQKEVAYHQLGLIIIDEQHRFGVEQRRQLQDKRGAAKAVHQLIMTATPIPRTLAMTFYADLDYSVIDQLPPGRAAVETVAINNHKRGEVIASIAQACRENRQAYWVCTLVEESETLQCQAAESTADELAAQLPDITVGLIHGRLNSEQKQQLMSRFRSGEIQLLVATTVIEVGVDVANASLMVIENPERLGLSQLHQLRGRIGRGRRESHCILLYQQPLSKNGRQRIEAMRSTSDGFKLAEYDLKMRGPGELLGSRQSGSATFRIADMERDSDLLEAAVIASDALDAEDPSTAAALVQRWCPLAGDYLRA